MTTVNGATRAGRAFFRDLQLKYAYSTIGMDGMTTPLDAAHEDEVVTQLFEYCVAKLSDEQRLALCEKLQGAGCQGRAHRLYSGDGAGTGRGDERSAAGRDLTRQGRWRWAPHRQPPWSDPVDRMVRLSAVQIPVGRKRLRLRHPQASCSPSDQGESRLAPPIAPGDPCLGPLADFTAEPSWTTLDIRKRFQP